MIMTATSPSSYICEKETSSLIFQWTDKEFQMSTRDDVYKQIPHAHYFDFQVFLSF